MKKDLTLCGEFDAKAGLVVVVSRTLHKELITGLDDFFETPQEGLHTIRCHSIGSFRMEFLPPCIRSACKLV